MVFALAALMVGDLGNSPGLVPWPNSIRAGQGVIHSGHPTIGCPDSSLRPHAEVFADEIFRVTGHRPRVITTSGTINLRLTGGKPSEAYRIETTESIQISANSVKGITPGTSTLLQAIQPANKGISIPKMSITDRPTSPYRGLLIDVARRYHRIATLKQTVELCRLYKLNYLQLHLTDDQSFMFPSRAFPKLSTQNTHGGPTYTRQELQDLVKFADVRGVTIVPELDIPGHSAAMIRAMPELFKISGTTPYEHHATINFANPKVIAAIDTLVGEMCVVFKSSPYFHMGGDEADISNAHQHPDFKAAFKELNLPDNAQHEIFRRFLTQVNEMVKRRKKQLIVWEGFGRDANTRFQIPRDVMVMQFENAYYQPNELLDDGYSVINASWTPLYVVNRHVWPAREIFSWSPQDFGRFTNLLPTTEWTRIASTERIQGAQVCSWEGPEEIEIQNLRRIVPAMAERTWGPRASRSYGAFAGGLAKTDEIFDKLVQPVRISVSDLDAVDPNGFDVPCFTTPQKVSLTSSTGSTIRYTADGSYVTATSPIYASPIEVSQTTSIRARTFDKNGQGSEYESGAMFYYVPPRKPNLATNRPVTTSGGTEGSQVPELAVDDNLSLSSSWWAAPGPQWLKVDLQAIHSVDRIEVFPYWDGARYYQYTVEVSLDGIAWETVADRSTNTVPAAVQGDELKFTARSVQFVRINMLRTNANPNVHLVELKVWPARP